MENETAFVLMELIKELALIIVKELPVSEIKQLALIDRSELVTSLYSIHQEELVHEAKHFEIPAWSLEDNGSHSVPAKVRGMEESLTKGILLGAYVNGQLAGLGSIRYGLTKDTAQLLSLHVSKPFRRQGVASAIYQELERLAVNSGARFFYVSACPTGSAVGFYTQKGFEPTAKPHPKLYKEEPEDIHMIKKIA